MAKQDLYVCPYLPSAPPPEPPIDWSAWEHKDDINNVCLIKDEDDLPKKIESLPSPLNKAHISKYSAPIATKMPAKTRSQIKVSPTYTATTPVAPTKITDYKKIAAERKETRRKEMMATAIPKLAYMKTLLDLIKAAPCSDATTCRNEILEDFNTKIANLEVDAAGLPRYNYILSYKMDNGDDVMHNQKEFNSSQMVYDFIHDMVLTEDGKDDYDYSEKAYTIPSAAEIDSMMDAHRYNDSKQILFVGEEFINSVEFTLKRTQVNY